jgi:hypothetical protein
MAHILNVKMGSKDFFYILFKMRIENKPYGINFELGAYCFTTIKFSYKLLTTRRLILYLLFSFLFL